MIAESIVEEYGEAMLSSSSFPPITVFSYGERNWLADGYHRFHAARKAGLDKISAKFRTGTKLDALKYALSANTKHGLRRSQEDRKRAVLIALKQFGNLSYREIAKIVQVDDKTIGKYRSRLKVVEEITRRILGGESFTGFHGEDDSLYIVKLSGPYVRMFFISGEFIHYDKRGCNIRHNEIHVQVLTHFRLDITDFSNCLPIDAEECLWILSDGGKLALAAISEIFDQPGAWFVHLPAGRKSPPLRKEWQNNPWTFQEAKAHSGNVGIVAGNGYIGLDMDDLTAFSRLELPRTTTWQTRPGRSGLWFRCGDTVEALEKMGKKHGLSQIKLFTDGRPVGEIKLQNAYQVIPDSWKELEGGQRVDYILLDPSPPVEISLSKLLADLQARGITFSKLESNAAKLENMVAKVRLRHAESDEKRNRRCAEAALRKEVLKLASTPEGGRNDQLNKSAFAMGQFVSTGILSEEETIRALTQAAYSVGLETEETRKTIQSGLEAGQRCQREIPGTAKFRDDDGKGSNLKRKTEHQKRIMVNDRSLNDITNDALEALIDYNDPPRIFSRAGSLVRLHKSERYVIEPLTRDSLKYALAKSASFYVLGEGVRVREVEVSPPNDVANNILAAEDWPGIPEIKGIIQTPIIRQDGSILSVPGYDEDTKLYLDPILDLSGLAIAEELTQKDAAEASQCILNEIFSDFPFENNASRTNILATLLSVIVRSMINGNVPITILDKPQAGTGASLIADIISITTTGRPASMWGMPYTEDEWRKAITSALVDGSPVIVIDNVTGRLQSASLARALSAKIWQDRILGKSQMVALPQEAVWIATGNNIEIGGDIARRAIWVRLDAAQARPWTRTGFRHPDLLGWIIENRAQIIAQLLIMARAWALAGKPPGSARLGGFNEWAKVISGILEFAGVPDFMGNASQLYDQMDVDVQQWDSFLEEWSVLHGCQPIRAGVLRDELTSLDPIYATLRDSMPEDVADAISKNKAGSLKLSHVLHKHLNQVYPSGRKLAQEMDKHSKVALWIVAGISKNQVSKSEDHFGGVAGVHSHSHAHAGARCNFDGVNQTPATPADKPLNSDCRNLEYPQTSAPIRTMTDRQTHGRSRHICRSCGKHSEIPLAIVCQDGYICEACRRDGPPPEPAKADPQSKLIGEGKHDPGKP
jgi:hypothetical protein